jgi:uncharacterized membrane protein YdjX (TVP38/TMEM64 family)
MTERRRRRPHTGDWRGWWPWVIAATVLLVLGVGWLALPLHRWIDDLQAWLLGWGAGGAWIFAVILIVATFLPAPDWPLPIAAGYVFGFWAFPLTYISIGFASVLAFLGARYLARDRVRAFLSRREKYRELDRAVAREGWPIVVLLRLSPIVPFNLQNYALGVTGIPFGQYILATLGGIAPGIAIYVWFGIFGKSLEKGVGVAEWGFFGLGVVATGVLAIIVAQRIKPIFA